MSRREDELPVDDRTPAGVVVLGVVRVHGPDQRHPGARPGTPAVHDAKLKRKTIIIFIISHVEIPYGVVLLVRVALSPSVIGIHRFPLPPRVPPSSSSRSDDLWLLRGVAAQR